jgi:hypothetical protein
MRIAQAFELPVDHVLADLVLLDGWAGAEQELLEWLRERHQWDPSVASHYVSWLRVARTNLIGKEGH